MLGKNTIQRPEKRQNSNKLIGTIGTIQLDASQHKLGDTVDREFRPVFIVIL